MASDGSFDRHWSTELMGIGWRIQCSHSSAYVEGYFASTSLGANSYRAELLGIYAIIVFLSLIEEVCTPSTSTSANMFCDNLRAIELSASLQAHIHPKKKHINVL